MKVLPWPERPVTLEFFRNPPREFGILPFWFLNGELDPDEMRFQLREFQAKGMPGIILHGRYGLEMPYLGQKYLDRICLAVEEAEKLGLKTWIYDEMNWPSGTADKRVLQARPDLAQRYIECINFPMRGPWFTYLTGADSRYLDFERSTPVAAFAICTDAGDAKVIDLTRYLSFGDVIPWEAPEGNWRLMYIVEKRADYYIDALDPESTREFLKHGYEPYAQSVQGKLTSQMPGFYTDEPAMHYYLTGGENPVVPWTKDMFRRFQERNGYNLRPRLPDLFFDIRGDSARVRYDFFNSLTDFYSEAYFKQIHEWCREHNVLFTGHLLYEEWMRKLVRVEGNLFRHYAHMDVIGVDHLYPIVGSRDRPDEHVAIKVASSAAHQYGSPRLLCESFGGIFMDATMQRMKWITDWEYVLGVNLLNPHGFHYTLEGPRKRDWPPSQFYQYPWWRYYGEFSKYVSRTSHMLSGGRHASRVAVLWPLNAIFGTYIPQSATPLAARMEFDFNVLTDTLLRTHYDFDYLDEDILAGAEFSGSGLRVWDEVYELIIMPPMTHVKLETLAKLEEFVRRGGRVLGIVFLPDRAFAAAASTGQGLVDISARVQALFGVDPVQSQRGYQSHTEITTITQEHPNGGKALFLETYALRRQLPLRLQQGIGDPGLPENPHFVIEAGNEGSCYFFAPPGEARQDITAEVEAERKEVYDALLGTLNSLLEPDITIDNPELFSLHRIKDARDIYFIVNPTFQEQAAHVFLPGRLQPLLWDPSSGSERPAAPIDLTGDTTGFTLRLAPAGSAFVLTAAKQPFCITDSNLTIESLNERRAEGYGRTAEAFIAVEKAGSSTKLLAKAGQPLQPVVLDGEWEFHAENDNTLVIGAWLAKQEQPGTSASTYALALGATDGWLPMGPGAWAYQLPAEPSAPYPLPVWYRIGFEAKYVPERLDLIVDGFAGSGWTLYVNGEPITAPAVRSTLDSQMKAIDIASALRKGSNTIALRLMVTSATDGLLDLVKLCGDFSLERIAEGGYRIAEPRRSSSLRSWTTEGYPFYSGTATYRRTFQLPEGLEPGRAERVFIEIPVVDDALEVTVNGQAAGVLLWPPYEAEVSDCLRPGENSVEIRVANTLVNELEAVERPSGLRGAPRLVPYHHFTFDFE